MGKTLDPASRYSSIWEGFWINGVLEELKVKIEHLLKLYSDSKTSKTMINVVYKHIEIDCQFIKKKLGPGLIYLPFIISSQQFANILNIYASTQRICWNNHIIFFVIITFY